MDKEDLKRVATDYLHNAEGNDAARVRFLEGLWALQEKFALPEHYALPSEQEARSALMSGRHLFTVSAPVIDAIAFSAAVRRVAQYVADEAGLPPEQADALRDVDFGQVVTDELLAEAPVDPQRFVDQVASSIETNEDGPLSYATVAFVLILALGPFLEGPALQAIRVLGKDREPSLWRQGRCPVCGMPATMGKVGESTQLQGGDRTLWCGVCDTEWTYDRLRCVRCGSRDSAKLRYAHVEGSPEYRLHLCDECHGFTKFVFVGDSHRAVAMPVEHVASAPLEGIAIEEGYTMLGDGGAKAC